MGLDDVIAAETALSEVDGERGTLIIAGRSLEDLATTGTFEQVAALLLAGLFDALPEDDVFADALGQARLQVFEQLLVVDATLLHLDPANAMCALVARIGDGEDLDTALRLIAAPAVFTSGLIRLRKGLPPQAPDASLGHAADMLRMAGLPNTLARARALDRYLITVSDHGLNASTFAARVVASTRAGLTCATLAGIGALKGPLHGGAPGPVLDMIDAIGHPEYAVAWLEAAVLQGQRLMGFGHRIYRVRDPRADALKAALGALVADDDLPSPRLALAEAVEVAAIEVLQRLKPGRPLQTNVEFYTALLLDMLGFDRGLFTCVFASGRVAGWIAHAKEQVLHGRLIRPQSRYIGVRPAIGLPA
ncbi:Citrate synthase 1 [Andreprevotia sp. IGB-42]|uniref:citrate synthase/methylcitrate synthase n=1 Tax=Andreprevotia sp. IGB-42 TaxID=2497473 RepID=UPI00157E39D6|nr:citrate synthase/methylcitrate synthase [Andreprevotia sp. IGB-42]KAF0812898.1 Citrate synthase 1 [Andreprevotia sp. IGB-42]